jgi:hypothetical protein
VALHAQPVPDELQAGVVPLHVTAQQMPPVPAAVATQLSLTHWLPAPTAQASPFAFLARQTPASHHRPVPHAASLGHGPHVTGVSQ